MAATLKNSSVYRVKTKQDNWRSEEEVLSYNIKKKLVEKYCMDDNINIFNGFLLNNSSDIDLTILVKDKLEVHPQEYSEGLLTLLKEYTESTWYIIKTDKLFIINCDDYKGMNVEITFNNITGIVNCEYIRTLAKIDSRFHKLGYYIKYFVKESNMFTKQNKLNSFSLMCMLIVYLQDIEEIKVLPRIMYSEEDLKNKAVEINSPVYINKYGKVECIINKLRVGYYKNPK